ncbi:MAG: TerB family tellurite resistance protein [Dongiaceae bacterium]
MIDRLLDFLTGRKAPALAGGPDELGLAVAALLIEAARMDDQFDATERATIERVLAEKFDLAPAAVSALMQSAEEAVRQSTQFFPFTQQIVKRISPEDRAQILEMMWEVAYADGVLDPYEDMLLRRIAGLINVSDQERGLARQRALETLKARDPGSN